MGANKLRINLLLLILLLLISGCKAKEPLTVDRTIVEKGDKKIFVLENSSYGVGDGVVASITYYEGLKSYGWWKGDQILGIADNETYEKALPEVYFDPRAFSFLKDKIKGAEHLWSGYLKYSPSGNYIFYVNVPRQKGYVLNSDGEVLNTLDALYTSQMAEATWRGDTLVMPSGDNQLLLVEGDEQNTYTLTTETDSGIMKAMATETSIFYTLYQGLERKLMVFNLETKENKLFIEDRVLDFELSPDGDFVIAEIYNEESHLKNLLMVDLESNNQRVLVEGQIIHGSKISPDGKRIAYFNDSRIDRAQGLYIIDIQLLEKHQISSDYSDIEREIFWNNQGKAIMVNSSEIIDGRWQSTTTVITLKIP